MQLPDTNYDPATVALASRACDDAWHEIQEKIFFPSLADERDVRHLIALRIISAVANGERDFERLKTVALEAIEG
jgi:hypothetical protein